MMPDVERRAQRLLDRVGIEAPPVDVHAVARYCGAVVRHEPAEGEISGALYRKGEVPVIGVNSSDASVRQRFTIAHEIAHLLLHDDSVFIDHKYLALESHQPIPRFLRDAVSSLAIDRKEIEANAFAACLLMPWRFLKRDVVQCSIPLATTDVTALARRYRVSAHAMMFRLQNRRVPIEPT